MTENEWVECVNPELMLAYLWKSRRNFTSERKKRLFAVACCRRIWTAFDGLSRNWIETAEKFADSNATPEEMNVAMAASERVYLQAQRQPSAAIAAAARATRATLQAGNRFAGLAARHAAWTEGWTVCEETETNRIRDNIEFETSIEPVLLSQCSLLRDIFGNLFRPITIDSRWLTSTVIDLANAIYQERTFDRMPRLASVLLDSGCDNDEIISHCRGDGPHVRGCWVVDLLLAKE